MHEEPWRTHLWEDVRVFPADQRWEGPGATADPDYRLMWEWYSSGNAVPYVPNLMPLDLHYRVAADLGQEVLKGRLNGAQAGERARERSQEWVRSDHERTARYREWGSELVA